MGQDLPHNSKVLTQSKKPFEHVFFLLLLLFIYCLFVCCACLLSRAKLCPMRNLRLLSNVQSHTSLPPSGMEGHSWTAYFVKGVYTDQPKLVCNSYVAVVVPQVPLVK